MYSTSARSRFRSSIFPLPFCGLFLPFFLLLLFPNSTVKGGPEYEVPLSGEASTIQGRLDRHVLDYGAINFDRLEEKELSIVNSGKVGFNFSVDVPPLEHSDEDGGAAMSVDDVCASILRVVSTRNCAICRNET